MSNASESINLQRAADVDWFLQFLVNVANRSSMEVGITLQVSGMLVSGSLVSGKEYFEGFGTIFSSAFSDPELAASIKKSVSSQGDIYADDDDEGGDQSLPQFIHLKNARFFNTAGRPIPGNCGVWWRGRICEVGGFSLGSLKQE